VSGAGKPSLASARPTRRRSGAIRVVAPYAWRLIEQIGVPEVDAIEGLHPQSRFGSSAARRARAPRSAA